MTTGETFESALKCPKCDKTGAATWVENAAPLHHGGQIDSALQSVSHGLRADVGPEPTIYCDTCKIAVSNL